MDREAHDVIWRNTRLNRRGLSHEIGRQRKQVEAFGPPDRNCNHSHDEQPLDCHIESFKYIINSLSCGCKRSIDYFYHSPLKVKQLQSVFHRKILK